MPGAFFEKISFYQVCKQKQKYLDKTMEKQRIKVFLPQIINQKQWLNHIWHKTFVSCPLSIKNVIYFFLISVLAEFLLLFFNFFCFHRIWANISFIFSILAISLWKIIYFYWDSDYSLAFSIVWTINIPIDIGEYLVFVCFLLFAFSTISQEKSQIGLKFYPTLEIE